MSKINNLNIYAQKAPIKSNDYWIGSRGDDGKTFNFGVGSVASFISAFLGLSGNISTGLISVQAITEDGLIVDVQDALYRINGSEYGPLSGTINIDAASDGFYRTDIIVGTSDADLVHIEGVENETASVQPATPANTVLIGIINIYGAEIVPEIPTTNYGWMVYQNLVYLKRQGNTNPNKIQGGDIVVGMMADNVTFIAFGAYSGTGDYFQASSYYSNPQDYTDVPATNTPI